MNRCKDCELFKNGCGFSNVDKKLGLDGNFVACGQFIKKQTESNFDNIEVISKVGQR